MLLSFLILVVVFIIFLLYRYPLYYRHVGYQFWSVGIGKVKSLNEKIVPEIYISYKYLQKQNIGDFIADPFLIKVNDKYYLFVEVAVNDFGRIDVFSSEDSANWIYEGIAIEEDTHMSYPQVFKFDGAIYMIPETNRANRVSLYKATDFPLKWEVVRDLLPFGRLDTTILFQDGLVFLFGVDKEYKLFCYYANHLLTGNFREHRCSPLGIGNKVRPAGKPFKQNGTIVLPVQSNKKLYGYAVYSLIINELTSEKIRYSKGKSLLKPIRKAGFFSAGVHHVCYLKDKDEYLFTMDGRCGTKHTYWMDISKTAFSNFINDIKTFFIIKRNNIKSIFYKIHTD